MFNVYCIVDIQEKNETVSMSRFHVSVKFCDMRIAQGGLPQLKHRDRHPCRPPPAPLASVLVVPPLTLV